MSLAEKISGEMRAAMKSGDKLRLETLRLIRAQLVEREIARGRGKMTEEDELSVLQTAVKKRRESIELFQKGGREDLVKREQKELEIVLTFLPEQMSVQEIEQVISSVIVETGASSQKDVGRVMAGAMKALRGKAEGKLVQDVARRLLETAP